MQNDSLLQTAPTNKELNDHLKCLLLDPDFYLNEYCLGVQRDIDKYIKETNNDDDIIAKQKIETIRKLLQDELDTFKKNCRETYSLFYKEEVNDLKHLAFDNEPSTKRHDELKNAIALLKKIILNFNELTLKSSTGTLVLGEATNDTLNSTTVKRFFSKEESCLNLSALQFQSIANNAFKNSINSSLQKLKLHRNLLKQIDPCAFHSLDNLQQLILSSNKLTSLNATWFTTLHSLTHLCLCDNKLEQLAPRVFKNLGNLLHLDLSCNEISDMDEEAFFMLTALQQLDLNDNRLRVIPSGTFRDLEQLQVLNLQFNAIYVLPAGVFRGLTARLKYLRLHVNELEVLDRDTFRDISGVQEITLHENRLRVIHQQAFEGLECLRMLNLSMNRLTELHSRLFVPVSETLEVLDLAENAILLNKKTFQVFGTLLQSVFFTFDLVTNLKSVLKLFDQRKSVKVCNKRFDHEEGA